MSTQEDRWTTIRIKMSTRNKLRMYQGIFGYMFIGDAVDTALDALDKQHKKRK